MKLISISFIFLILLLAGCDEDRTSVSSLTCNYWTSDENIDTVCDCNEVPSDEWQVYTTPNCYYKNNNTKTCENGFTLIGGSCVEGIIPAVDNSFNSYIDVGRFSFDGSAAVGSSVWKRNGLAGYIEDSLNITFWGESDLSCPVQVHGPTVGSFPWANIADVYTPYPSEIRSPICYQTGQSGSSFVTVQQGKGIGMYGHAGLDTKLPNGSLLLPYPLGTPGRSGLTATYLNFTNPWVLKPWASASGTVAIVTEQFVPSTVANDSKTQVQQNMRLVVLNQYCLNNRKPNQSCQFEWNVKLYIEGINSESDRDSVMFDPAQGGIAVILGSTEESNYWVNKGVNTQRTPYYGGKTFHIEMNWTQATNLFIEFTKEAFAAQGIIKDTVTSAEVAAHFGDAWQNRFEWVVADIGVGQEIYNPDQNDTASISGMVKSFDVIAK